MYSECDTGRAHKPFHSHLRNVQHVLMFLCVFELSLTMRAPRLSCVLINFNLSGIIAALNQLFRWLFELLFGSIQAQVANPTSYGSETIDLLYLPVGFFFLSLLLSHLLAHVHIMTQINICFAVVVSVSSSSTPC